MPLLPRRPIAKAAGLVLIAALPAACDTLQGAPPAPLYAFPEVAAEWNDLRITFDGILADGRPCAVLRQPDGTQISIQGRPAPYEPGSRLAITGPTARWSLCQTLQTIRADEIDLVLPVGPAIAIPGTVLVEPVVIEPVVVPEPVFVPEPVVIEPVPRVVSPAPVVRPAPAVTQPGPIVQPAPVVIPPRGTQPGAVPPAGAQPPTIVIPPREVPPPVVPIPAPVQAQPLPPPAQGNPWLGQ